MIGLVPVAGADVAVTSAHDVTVAEDGPGTMEAGLFVGTFISNYYHQFYDPDMWPGAEGTGTYRPNLDRWNPELGLRFALFPHRNVGVEAEASFVSAAFGEDSRLAIFGLGAQAIFQLPGKLTPFAALGWGVRAISSNSMGDDTDFPIHVGAGIRYFFTSQLALRVDGRYLRGPSQPDPYTLNAGYGELTLGLSYNLAPRTKGATVVVENPDPDGDGVIGMNDACPTEPAQTADGCPPKDSDGDGLLDPVDKCPAQPETMNTYQDDDGCPDLRPDTDGDKIFDSEDKCPGEAEDMDAFEDTDGCPEADNDQDGVTDTSDGCPMEKGPVENSGCPDKDRDGDGIVDRLDNCPDEAGTKKNYGCKAKQLAVITTTQIKILDKVYFRTAKATIEKRSNKLLDNVARVLNAHPEIKKLRVEGHTDDVGNDMDNKNLSQARADAVVQYLVTKGVDVSRLESVGFGEEKPVDPAKTRKAREQNRRVEFNIATAGPVTTTVPAP
jgi:outer membrane protein OmpA-like peptidoglycan-associated protein